MENIIKKKVDNITIKLTITKQTPVKTLLELGKNCSRCGNCCTHGSGIILPPEMKQLAKQLSIDEKEFERKYTDKKEKYNTKYNQFKLIKKKSEKDNKDLPFGRCVFYSKESGCTINGIKPLHCRITTCDEHGESINQWFHLNYLVNPDDPESIRQWAQVLNSRPTIPGGNLNELVPDENVLKKILNYEIMR